MTDRINQNHVDQDDTPRPSQAEGSRSPGSDDGDEESIPKPSQAEGDRETVDKDLAKNQKPRIA